MASVTPSMSMNTVIHRAVRRDLGRFLRAFADFPDGDRERAAALHRAWANFDAQLTDHHEGEHELVWPTLEAIGIDEHTIASFDAEHEAMAADLAAARVAMERLRDSASQDDALTAAAAISRLQRTTVTHLDHEEQVTEARLAEHHDDPVMKEMAKKLSRRTGPGKAGVFLAWLEDGATAEERAALRQSVPRPVVTVIGGVLGRPYRKQVAPVWRAGARPSTTSSPDS